LILYYAPDTDVPSWGIGMLYTHVRLLRANGIEAAILHQRPGFRPTWLDFDVPIVYARLHVDCTLLVVPEVFAADPKILAMARRRIVFVQADSYIAPGLRDAADYRALGYDRAIAAMPHISAIVERHYGVAAPVVPPSIAPYFFADRDTLDTRRRKRQVVVCPKPGCRDLPTVRQVLRHRLPAIGWRLVELEGRPHRAVARVFRESALHVNVNCHESFNATVPEAMAAGCVPVCYEAFGGRDYLRPGRNAVVFPTHDAFPLIERVLELAESFESDRVKRIRRAGYTTALRYTEKQTERALLKFYEWRGPAARVGERSSPAGR
jgi:glycosyltransferase involved in cell wall biosynthesis